MEKQLITGRRYTMKRLHKVAETYYRITYKTSDGDWTAECHVINGKRQSYCISNNRYYYFERALRTLESTLREYV